MQNKNEIKKYSEQKKNRFLESLVLKEKTKPTTAPSLLAGRQSYGVVKPSFAEGYGAVKPASAEGYGVVRENEYLNTVDLRSKKLREKQLIKIVDIKPRFFPAPQILLRTIAVLLIIGLNWTALTAVGTTVAVFHDKEGTSGNNFTAGLVDFSLTVTPFDTITASLNMESGASTSREVSIYPEGRSNPFQYYASSTNFSGDEDFCDALMVNASINGTEIFNGQLKNFTTATTTVLDTWEFIFTTEENHPNRVCHFDIDFNGWQTRNDLPGFEAGGYKDTETISSSIYSSGFRIQKVYFNQEGQIPSGGTIITGDATAYASVVNIVNTNITDITCDCDEGCDDGCGDVVVVNNNDATVVNNVNVSANTGYNSANGGDGETTAHRGWVEIYNQTNIELDLSGWKICNNIACDIIPDDTRLEPHGFAVVTEDATLWHEWNIPDNVVLITLSDSTIGGGIDPVADMIFIKRPDNVVIDQMNWGVPSYAWINYNSNVWDPGISVSTSTSPAGKVLAREPLGYDTNLRTDFTELGFPVVDLLYPNENNNSYIWYWGHTYLIKWNAFNQNGNDNDLLVDIFAIFDENGNGRIDGKDMAHVIALGTENDGKYSLTVPEGFIGTIWIQIVARGPENPMLFSGTISGDIWDPIPEDLADNYKDEYFAQQLGFKGFHVGAAPVQAPALHVQGLPLDTNDVVNKGLSVGDEGEDAAITSDESTDTPPVADEDLLEDDEELYPPMMDGQDSNPPVTDGQDPEPVLPEPDGNLPIGEDNIEEATLPEEIPANIEENENDEPR